MNEIKRNPVVLASAAVVVVGLAAWVYQLVNGLGITGMSNATSWGLYLACFMFFGGVASGCLAMAASVEVFGLEKWRGIQAPAVICALVGICCAGICVLLDLGGIQRVWRMVVGLNIESPLAWDMLVITLSIVVDALFLHALVARPGDLGRRRVLAWVALPLAVLCVAVEAWVFGMEVAKDAWSAMLAPVFVASSLDSGLALLLLALLGLRANGRFAFGEGVLEGLARLLAVFVAVDFLLVFCEVATAAYTGEALAGLVLSGSLAPLFWTEMLCGIAIPFAVLAMAANRAKPAMVALACALVLVGVFCKRCWVLLSGFAQANVVAGPGITLGTAGAQAGGVADMWSLGGAYVPSAPEAVIAVAVFALACLAFAVLHALLVKEP